MQRQPAALVYPLLSQRSSAPQVKLLLSLLLLLLCQVAKDRFQTLQRIYAVLSDPDK